jgi:hypothetical protein
MSATHHPNVAKPGASWDDAVTFAEHDSEGRLLHGVARVTAEFMADSDRPVEAVVGLLRDRADG